MNIVLFREPELTRPLPPDDPRAVHILSVLGKGVGDRLDAGLVDGPRGKARVERVDAEGLHLSFDLTIEPPPLAPVTLLVGAPRPAAARRILREATSLGAGRMIFCGTRKGERSYLSAGLWRNRRFESFLLAGAEQAFDTRLPVVEIAGSLADALALLTPEDTGRVALDNYEAAISLGEWNTPAGGNTVMAVGAERGWSGGERRALTEHGFTLARLGDRVLRTETACLAGLAVLLASLPRRSGGPSGRRPGPPV